MMTEPPLASTQRPSPSLSPFTEVLDTLVGDTPLVGDNVLGGQLHLHPWGEARVVDNGVS